MPLDLYQHFTSHPRSGSHLPARTRDGILCQHPTSETNVPTRNVVLTDHQATIVERLVASGRYQNASEVLREGLRLIESREAETAARLAALQDAARIGIADIEAGRFRAFDAPDVLDRHLSTLAGEVIGGA
jgi:antitoxin ParD1/3/4